MSPAALQALLLALALSAEPKPEPAAAPPAPQPAPPPGAKIDSLAAPRPARVKENPRACAKAKFRPERLIERAKAYLDVPYSFGGRSKKHIDCLGLIFLPHQQVYGGSWRKLSVMPTTLAPQLGEVSGYLAAEDVVAGSIADPPERGDLLFFLSDLATADGPFLEDPAGVKLWVVHTAIYLGEGRFLHASPWAGRVVEEDLGVFLLEQTWLSGLVRIRMPR